MNQDLSDKAIAHRLSKLGLTPDEFDVIDVLDDDDVGWSLRDLAKATCMSRRRTFRTVRTLEDRELVLNNNFGRILTLTPAGTELAAEARASLGLERMRDVLADLVALGVEGVTVTVLEKRPTRATLQ